MTKRRKQIIIFIIIIWSIPNFLMSIFSIISGPGFGSGSIGIRPMTHGCIGFYVPVWLTKILPNGNYGISATGHFNYYVNSFSDTGYCLGQDTYWGE